MTTEITSSIPSPVVLDSQFLAHTTIDDWEWIRKAEVSLEAYIKFAKKDAVLLENMLQVASDSVLLKWHKGRILRNMEKSRGAMGSGSNQHEVRLNDATTPTYTELGIEKTTAYREQVMAQAFTEDEIIAMCAEIRGEGQLPTFTHFLRLAKAKSLENIPHLENPDNTYHTIVVDPPWPTEKINREVRPYQSGFDYKTMSLEKIKALPVVRDSARTECHLYLWTTQKYLKDSFEVMEAWGFQAIFTMVWNKRGGYQPFGLPQYTTEFVLFGRIGGLGFLETKGFSTSFEGERRGHSVKPIEFYEIVKRVSPTPRLDVFSREKHDGFDSWGAEVDTCGG